jgi:hypothetical protein
VADLFYDWFDDEWDPRPVSKTPPTRLAARRKLLDSLLVKVTSADDPLAWRLLTPMIARGRRHDDTMRGV